MLRKRVPEDIHPLVRILRAVHQTHGYPVRWPEDPGEWLTPTSMWDAWVAVTRQRIIGHVAVSRNEEADPAGLWVERLFVDPDEGGSGVGTFLLRQCLVAASAGGRQLGLRVTDDAHAAIRLYESTGWRQVGSEDIAWGGPQATTLLHYEPTRAF